MKVSVDREKCIGSVQCTQTAPQIFELKEGKFHVKLDEIPSEFEDKCKQAAEVVQ